MWRWVSHLEPDTRHQDTRSGVGGTGSATTLHMTDEEREEAAKRKRPIGFMVDPPRPRNRRRSA